MNIESNQILKLRLSDIEGIDPITVILEDIAPRQGKIIIECWGKSWAASWGGMGDRTIAEFFIDCNNGYLIGNLARGLNSMITDYDNLKDWLKKKLIDRRKDKDYSKEETKELWKEIDLWTEDNEHFLHTETGYSLACKCVGEEFWYDLPEVKNPDYLYLSRIVDAVRDGLKQYFKLEAK